MGAPDTEKLWELWQHKELEYEQATGYMIQIVVEQERLIMSHGRAIVTLEDGLVQLRQELVKLRKEVRQLRRLVDKAQKK